MQEPIRDTIQQSSSAKLQLSRSFAPPGFAEPLQLSWVVRSLALLVSLASIVMLATARQLEPSPWGWGTHQQLGLPPCASLVLFDMACPACGMTTSWAHAVRADFQLSASANLGGLILAVIALVNFPASCYFFVTGRATSGGWYSLLLASSLAGALLVAICQWAWR
jgi:hypothetical protein